MASDLTERAHQDSWYAQADRERFFEREGFRRLVAHNLARVRDAVTFTPASRVLSLGCGSGEYEVELAGEVEHLTAVDLSPVAIAVARGRSEARGVVNIRFVEGALLEVSLPAGGFDVVYAFGVLHHLSRGERHALLLRARDWLVPGGTFYARDPNRRGLLRLTLGWAFARSRFHSPNEAALDPFELQQELVAAGFRDPRLGYTDVLAGPLPWIVPWASGAIWTPVFACDRAWLAVPGLRRLASQFDITATR